MSVACCGAGEDSFICMFSVISVCFSARHQLAATIDKNGYVQVTIESNNRLSGPLRFRNLVHRLKVQGTIAM